MDENSVAIKDPQLYTLTLCPTQLLWPVNYNPQDTSDEEIEALKQSIAQDPDFLKVRPLIVNTYPTREGAVIGGNKRLRSVQELGWEKVPVIFVKVDPNKEKVWNIKDNHHNGTWNPEKKKGLLLEIRDSGFNMAAMGFTPNSLLGGLSGTVEKQDHKDDPNYQGTTPGKTREFDCPECSAHLKLVKGKLISG